MRAPVGAVTRQISGICEAKKTMNAKSTENLDLAAIAALLPKGQIPPVESWHPKHCSDLDIRIARDGTWFYLGSPINRRRMVKLFSSILRHDADGRHYLVTPVEKIGITVDDAPFVAVAMTVHGSGRDQALTFRTHVDDEVLAGPEHPIRIEIESESGEPSPYVHIRGGLEALINRPVFYDLVDLGVERKIDGELVLGVWSAGKFFAIGPVPDAAE